MAVMLIVNQIFESNILCCVVAVLVLRVSWDLFRSEDSNIFLIFPLWCRSLQHTCRRQGRWGKFPTAACALQVNCLSFPFIFSITFFMTYCCILSLLNFMVTSTQSKISSHVTNAPSDLFQSSSKAKYSPFGGKTQSPNNQVRGTETKIQKTEAGRNTNYNLANNKHIPTSILKENE